MRLAADIGGTFTDIAVFDDKTGALTFGKALSTPQRLVDGINRGVERPAATIARRGCSFTARRLRSTRSSSVPAPRPRC
jgi:N-methylhydantoinase A